jgi:hypothetical protein
MYQPDQRTATQAQTGRTQAYKNLVTQKIRKRQSNSRFQAAASKIEIPIVFVLRESPNYYQNTAFSKVKMVWGIGQDT